MPALLPDVVLLVGIALYALAVWRELRARKPRRLNLRRYSFRVETKDSQRMIYVEDTNLMDAWATALERAKDPTQMVIVGPSPWPQ